MVCPSASLSASLFASVSASLSASVSASLSASVSACKTKETSAVLNLWVAALFHRPTLPLPVHSDSSTLYVTKQVDRTQMDRNSSSRTIDQYSLPSQIVPLPIDQVALLYPAVYLSTCLSSVLLKLCLSNNASLTCPVSLNVCLCLSSCTSLTSPVYLCLSSDQSSPAPPSSPRPSAAMQ